MRPLTEMETPKPTTSSVQLSPQIPTPPLPNTRAPCNSQIHDCRWWPYAKSSDFGANTAIIAVTLLCALICALALNVAIRCFLRSGSNNTTNNTNQNHSTESQNNQTRKPNSDKGLEPPLVAPKLVYTEGLKLCDGDCAICLSEFVEGEGIRVLGRCKHGFHANCIDKWLSTHSSCPTCRGSCLASSSSSSSSSSLEIGPNLNPVPMQERADPERLVIYAVPFNMCL